MGSWLYAGLNGRNFLTAPTMMKLQTLAVLALTATLGAACSKSEPTPVGATNKAPAALQATVLEKKLPAKIGIPNEQVAVFCAVADIGCYQLVSSMSRITTPATAYAVHYQLSGKYALGAKVYYALAREDKKMAARWLKDLNTVANAHDWAVDWTGLEQWTALRSVNLAKLKKAVSEFEQSAGYKSEQSVQTEAQVGVWPFYTHQGVARHLDKTKRQAIYSAVETGVWPKATP